jgi:hypothetical protein
VSAYESNFCKNFKKLKIFCQAPIMCQLMESGGCVGWNDNVTVSGVSEVSRKNKKRGVLSSHDNTR